MSRRRGQRKGWLREEHGSWLLTYRVYDQTGRGRRETVTIGPSAGKGKLTEKQAERFAWDHYLSKVDQIAQQPRALMSIEEFGGKALQARRAPEAEEDHPRAVLQPVQALDRAGPRP